MKPQPSRRFTPTCVGTADAASTCVLEVSVHPHVRGDGVSCTRIPTWRSVHPHVRGDGRGVPQCGHLSAGSPPRAWGRLQFIAPRRRIDRFTPTCVGTAISMIGSHNSAYGSPPRAWGRRGNRCYAYRGERFTPTCVGTAWRRPRCRRGRTVHPHVRGDGLLLWYDALCSHGSPPRAWGRRAPGWQDEAAPRFTPTCVGTAEAQENQFDRIRFTPTCVGTALSSHSLALYPAVHPHVRGDGRNHFVGHFSSFGSPPRAWGRRDP